MVYCDGRTLQARIASMARMAVEMHLAAEQEEYGDSSPRRADDRRRRQAGGTGQWVKDDTKVVGE